MFTKSNKRKTFEENDPEGTPNSPLENGRAQKRAGRGLSQSAEGARFQEESFSKFRSQTKAVNDRLGKVIKDASVSVSDKEWTLHEYNRLLAEARALYHPVSDAQVMVCGSNDCFQMGNARENTSEAAVGGCLRPRKIKKFVNVTHVAAGSIFNAVLTSEGRVYTWGSSDDGVLGRRILATDDAEHEQMVPSRVQDLIPSRKATVPIETSREDSSIVQVAAGGTQMLMLSIHGSVYMTGGYKSSEGKFWRDMPPPDVPDQDPVLSEGMSNEPAPRGYRDLPRHVWQLPQRARAIACGGSMNAAILYDQSLVTWGWDNCGELGRKITEQERKDVLKRVDRPSGKGYDEVVDQKLIQERFLKPLPPLWKGMLPNTKMSVLSVSCGDSHMLVAARKPGSADSHVYSTGLNNYGQLGLGDTKNRSELTLSESSKGKDIVQVAAGQHHSLFLDLYCDCVYACGRADSSQLGLSDTQPKSGDYEASLKAVPFDDATMRIVSIAAGDTHSLAVTGDGKVYTWGFGDEGALGHGVANDEHRPKAIAKYSGKADAFVLEASGGSQHSCLLVSSTPK